MSYVRNQPATHREQFTDIEEHIEEASDTNEGSIREATMMYGEDSSDGSIKLEYAILYKNNSPIAEIMINEPSIVSSPTVIAISEGCRTNADNVHHMGICGECKPAMWTGRWVVTLETQCLGFLR